MAWIEGREGQLNFVVPEDFQGWTVTLEFDRDVNEISNFRFENDKIRHIYLYYSTVEH